MCIVRYILFYKVNDNLIVLIIILKKKKERFVVLLYLKKEIRLNIYRIKIYRLYYFI